MESGLQAAELRCAFRPQLAQQVAQHVLNLPEITRRERIEATLLQARAINETIEDNRNHSAEAEALMLTLSPEDRAEMEGRWLAYLTRIYVGQQRFDQVLKLWDTSPALHDAPLIATVWEVAAAKLDADPREAARAARIALDADPYSREALAVVLRALLAYRAAQERFAELGEKLPEDWAEFVSSPNT